VRKTVHIFGMVFSRGFFAGMILLLICLCSCGAGKLIQEKEAVAVVKTEDMKRADSNSVKVTELNNNFQSHTEETKDTMVGGGKTEISLTETELQPVTDAAGEKQGRTFRVDNGDSHMSIEVDKKGGIKAKCDCDSIRVANRRLIKDSISNSQIIDSLMSRISITNHSEIKDSVATQKVVVEKKQGLAARIVEHAKNGLALFGLLCVVVIFIRHLINRYTA
jgi:hypothetical protein